MTLKEQMQAAIEAAWMLAIFPDTLADKLSELARKHYEGEGWLPIEQAPKRGYLLLYFDGNIDVGSYDNLTQSWRYNWKEYESIQPTHFMQLPTPPHAPNNP